MVLREHRPDIASYAFQLHTQVARQVHHLVPSVQRKCISIVCEFGDDFSKGCVWDLPCICGIEELPMGHF